MQVVILAGGKGSRLKVRPPETQKCMMVVAGAPFLTWVVRSFELDGFSRFLLCLGHNAESVRDYFGSGERLGVSLSYSFDGPTNRGTGGALDSAYDLLEDQFLITYGDTYLEFNKTQFMNTFLKNPEAGLMAVVHNPGPEHRPNARYEVGSDSILYTKNYQKNTGFDYLDYGLVALNKDLLSRYMPNKNEFDLSDILEPMSYNRSLKGLTVPMSFHEIGTDEALSETEIFILNRHQL